MGGLCITVKRDVRKAGGDEGGQGRDGRTVLREM